VYHFEIRRAPYSLSDGDKNAMRTLFERVMGPLSFRAKPGFVEMLFDTAILARVFGPDGTLAAFGNIRIRESGGRMVRHVLAVYVDPAHRGHHLSVRAVATALWQEAVLNWCCLFSPLYVTGSAVNPMVVKSLSRRIDLWPDLETGSDAPLDVARIAEDTAQRFYPVRGTSMFQVGITADVAEVLVDGERQITGDVAFDRKFFEIARPEELRLLLFVGRIRFRHVLRATFELLAASIAERAGQAASRARAFSQSVVATKLVSISRPESRHSIHG
jgi:hypothetical protein